MNAIKVIGLAGNRQVGKDSFFAAMNELRPGKFRRYAFADALKDDLDGLAKNMFGKRAKELNAKEKEIMRPIFIAFGCSWREIDPLHWVKIVDRQIEWDRSMLDGINAEARIACSLDHRFTNEIKYFKEKYGDSFVCIGLSRDDAPPPTDEEKKNWPEVEKLVDIRLNWPTLDEKARMGYVNEILVNLGL
jgi:hypothetical protein